MSAPEGWTFGDKLPELLRFFVVEDKCRESRFPEEDLPPKPETT